MSESYKHSYKVGEDFLNSLSVYNVGYQKCEPEYQWGPGIRDHYCIHHILSGSGVYTTGKVSVRLNAGDTFILFPGVELQYQADKDEPWEYCWAGFMGTDAASIIRNTGFCKETPYILKGKIPEEEVRSGLEEIYKNKGNTYESSVAMTGSLYSLLAVFMHYADRTEPEKDSHVMYVEKAMSYIETNYSYPITVEDIAYYVGISRSHLFRSFQNYMRKSPDWYRFNDDLLIYDLQAGNWSIYPDMPGLARAGGILLEYQDRLYMICGEIKPGIRTPQITVIPGKGWKNP